MPTPRLGALLLQFCERRLGARKVSGFFEQGTIASVSGIGNVVVTLDEGRTVSASPTTDEPFEAGHRVWVSKTEQGGYIVHGGVR
jgi:hypothetical protein